MSRFVPVRDAAITLGVSEMTLKRRLKAGTLSGQREQTPYGYRWLVELPDEDLATPESEFTGTDGHICSQCAELVGELRRDKDRFWSKVEARRQEVRELHVLLQQAQA